MKLFHNITYCITPVPAYRSCVSSSSVQLGYSISARTSQTPTAVSNSKREMNKGLQVPYRGLRMEDDIGSCPSGWKWLLFFNNVADVLGDQGHIAWRSSACKYGTRARVSRGWKVVGCTLQVCMCRHDFAWRAGSANRTPADTGEAMGRRTYFCGITSAQ